MQGPFRQTMQNARDIDELEKNGIRDASLDGQIASYDSTNVAPREQGLMSMFDTLDKQSAEQRTQLNDTDAKLKELDGKTSATEEDYNDRAKLVSGQRFDTLFGTAIADQDKALADGKASIDGDLDAETKPDTLLGRLGFENIPIGQNRFGLLDNTALGPALDYIQDLIDRMRARILGFIDNFSERFHSIDGRGGLVKDVLATHNGPGGLFDQLKSHIEALRDEIRAQFIALKENVNAQRAQVDRSVDYDVIIGFDRKGSQWIYVLGLTGFILEESAAALYTEQKRVHYHADNMAIAYRESLAFVNTLMEESAILGIPSISYREAVKTVREGIGEALRGRLEGVKDRLVGIVAGIADAFRAIATALMELVLFPLNVIQENLGLPETEAGKIMGLIPQLTRMTQGEFVNFQASEGAVLKGPFQSGSWRPGEWGRPGFTDLSSGTQGGFVS